MFLSLSISLSCFFFFFQSLAHLRDLHSFPTRRSSDLARLEMIVRASVRDHQIRHHPHLCRPGRAGRRDRKSTRLNSSHGSTSYAVFCLKKKTKATIRLHRNSAPRVPDCSAQRTPPTTT